jgi:hypothetical protein
LRAKFLYLFAREKRIPLIGCRMAALKPTSLPLLDLTYAGLRKSMEIKLG